MSSENGCLINTLLVALSLWTLSGLWIKHRHHCWAQFCWKNWINFETSRRMVPGYVPPLINFSCLTTCVLHMVYAVRSSVFWFTFWQTALLELLSSAENPSEVNLSFLSFHDLCFINCYLSLIEATTSDENTSVSRLYWTSVRFGELVSPQKSVSLVIQLMIISTYTCHCQQKWRLNLWQSLFC